MLNEIVKIKNPNEFKIHVASRSSEHQPLDVFVASKEKWKDWNSWRSEKDDFNREYIFSLIDFYHEKDIWLFGGIFKVLKRNKKPRSLSYKVELLDQSKPFIGRLKLKWHRVGRTRSRKMENCIDDFVVSEILKEEYTGETFCGYENINHDFHILESIFLSEKQDWKAALENVKGVYVITDKNNGKKYVGSAYGVSGIWSRWDNYIRNGHGHNDELIDLINQKGIKYARRNFKFTLLEYRSMKVDDKDIFAREVYWKQVLLSCGEFGYNLR